MPITETERSEMVNELSVATSPKTTETLMKCVLPDGRDHLATKRDLEVVEHGLRADFADLRADFAELKSDFADLKSYVDVALAKQSRQLTTTLVGFMLTTWTTMLVFFAV